MDQETLRREADEQAQIAAAHYHACITHGVGMCEAPGPIVAAIIVGAAIDRLARAVERLAVADAKAAKQGVPLGFEPDWVWVMKP